MATMILLPDGASGHTSDWVANSTFTHEAALTTDNGDISYVACSTDSARLTVTFANPSVAAADIDFTQTVSVQFLSSGRSTNRRFASAVDIQFDTPFQGFSETVSYDAHASSYETINGTSREYPDPSDSSTDWTYSNLEALSLRLTKNAAVEVRLSYFALQVTYTPAAAGYGNDVNGIASGNIGKVNGIATSNISKVNGV